MAEDCLIIFLRNPELGKVKTRLAATVGDDTALAIYLRLLQKTRLAAEEVDVDRALFYSEYADREDSWANELFHKALQHGYSLGERMQNAFQQQFEAGYKKVCIIGTDCWELSATVIEEAFNLLNRFDCVLGPAEDGGYYLLGMKKLLPDFFENKNWGTDTVLEETLRDIQHHELTYALLPTLRDIDDESDLPEVLRLSL